MSRIVSSAAARRFKTAIASETNNIQKMSERFIAESNDYLIRRISQGTYDSSLGEDPIVNVRYSTAPIEETGYIDLLTTGDVEEDMVGRGCNGENEDFTTQVNRRGAPGCNLAGQTIHGGYDQFFRTIKGKAFETEVVCALDLIQKMHYNAYLAMIRNDLPKRAMEQFGYSLERNVIDLARYNTSVVEGFTFSAGAFPAIPQGMLDLATIRRVFTIMEAQGWTGAREVTTSVEAFENMKLNYKRNTGLEMTTSVVSGETHFLDKDTTVVSWAGITWVLLKNPTRGYLETVNGNLQFRAVRPTKPRIGTGAGIVTDVNEDYFNCRTVCNGQSHELFEIGYYIHPLAAQRQSFAVPAVANKSFPNARYNFEVDMIDGPYVPCNVDNLKFYYRLKHAYGFQSTMPETMGACIYRIQPDIIYINTPCCDTACPGDEITMAPANPQPTSDCIQDDIETEDVAFIAARLPEPTEDAPLPAPAAGTIRFRNTAITTNTAAGTVRVEVERIGGVDGAATVTLDNHNGTALSGTDYTNFAATLLSWADGEAGVKFVDVTILPGGAGDVAFTVARTLPVGAAWQGATSATITIEPAPVCPEV